MDVEIPVSFCPRGAGDDKAGAIHGPYRGIRKIRAQSGRTALRQY
jgi:hypothetical protein